MTALTAATGIDLTGLFDGMINAVQTGVQDNVGPALLVGGGIVAIGVVWRVVKRAVKG